MLKWLKSKFEGLTPQIHRVPYIFHDFAESINQMASVWVLKSGRHSATLTMNAARSSETSA
jgi:hypothetical protein